MFGAGETIGEIAAAAAGDQDFLARRIGMVEDAYAPASLPGDGCAHQAGRTGADDQHIGRGMIGSIHAPIVSVGGSTARGFVL